MTSYSILFMIIFIIKSSLVSSLTNGQINLEHKCDLTINVRNEEVIIEMYKFTPISTIVGLVYVFGSISCILLIKLFAHTSGTRVNSHLSDLVIFEPPKKKNANHESQTNIHK
jgi:hypothetical protein